MGHKYLESALKFLGHSQPSDLPKKERVLFASDLCLAALLSPRCYDFSELLAHEMVRLLKGTAHEWLYEMMALFNIGDLQKWAHFSARTENARAMKAHSAVSANLAFLEQKIRLMALLDLVFRTPPNERCLAFGVISRQCLLAADEVELVLMRAFSLGLLKGEMDEVAQTVSVVWCAPRSLQRSQIAQMKGKLETWIAKIETAQKELKKN